ncbi:MAG: aldo/keto reductase [Planctomycetota bacterium]|nr:aldo/keto reductase [Planctomycetota bacterium]
MKYRTLGKSGIHVSEIGVGAWQLGGPLLLDGKMDGHPDVGSTFAVDLIRRCNSELGINFIDTAEQYGAGESERRVGQALEGQRDKWIISTKFGAQVGDVVPDPATKIPSGKRVNDVSATRVPLSLENSLRKLRTDHIDIYLYHSAPDPAQAEPVARFLESAKRKGQIRAAGISTANFAFVEFLHSLGCLDVVQFPQNMIDRQEQIAAFLAQHNIGGVVRGAFAGGRLSGKYFHTPPKFAAEDIRNNKFRAEAIKDFTRYAVLEQFLTPDCPMPRLALRWLLDKPTTHTIILGAKSFEEYRDAAAATDLPPIPPSKLSQIDTALQSIAR